MEGALQSILDAVGQTPIVRLNRVGSDVASEIFVKCEYLSPSGSVKDRMAARMVEAAVESGALLPGGTIVEATTGDTGLALAMLASVRGYLTAFVVPDKTSAEKIAMLRAYGSRVVVAPAGVEPDDPRSMRGLAKSLAEETPGAVFLDQFENTANPDAHAATLGAEILAQTGGNVDAVVAGIGTGGTLVGVGRALRAAGCNAELVGVDPSGSVYYGFKKSGRVAQPVHYKLEGIGSDFFPANADLDALDHVVRVRDGESFRMARDLVRLEGLFVGGSSGAAVAGALAYARSQASHKRVLVILPDGAGAYLSTLFNDAWMEQNGFLDDEGDLGTVRDLLQQKGGEGVITARSDDRVRDVIGRMKAHGISQLPVMRDDALLGVVAEVDLLRYLVSGESSLEGAVEQVVESDFATVTPDTKILSLQQVLSEARIAIVLEDDRIAGIITKIDLIDYLARRAQ